MMNLWKHLEGIEQVINIPKLENDNFKPIFGDTENLISKGIALPRWGRIYKRFKEENYI
jgi:hypothetical protein